MKRAELNPKKTIWTVIEQGNYSSNSGERIIGSFREKLTADRYAIQMATAHTVALRIMSKAGIKAYPVQYVVVPTKLFSAKVVEHFDRFHAEENMQVAN